MNILTLVAASLVIQAAPQADVYSLVPEIIDVAVEKSPWTDGYPAGRPIAVDFGSFVSEFARVTDDAEAGVSDAVDDATSHRLVRYPSQPWCDRGRETRADFAADPPFMFLVLTRLQRTSAGYRARISYTYPTDGRDGRCSIAFVSFGVAFEYEEAIWSHRFVGREIRT